MGREPGTGPTRPAELLITGIVAGVLFWVVAKLYYGSFVPIPLLAGVPFIGLAVIETGIGFFVRQRVTQREISSVRGHLHPLTAARVLALAKASAVLGAIAAGVWSGLLVYVYNSDLAAAEEDRLPAVIGAVGAVLLVGAALWLEYCCRAPDDPTGGVTG